MIATLLSLALAALNCGEVNLAHFYQGARELAPEIVGKDDPCDGFGEAGIYTPRHHIWFFVNFNIPAQLDTDTIDDAIDRLPSKLQRFFEKIDVAVVPAGWVRRTYGHSDLFAMSWEGSIFFIDARLAADPAVLRDVLREFYSDPRERP